MIDKRFIEKEAVTPIKKEEPKQFKIYDILIIQFLLCIAGLTYGVFYKDLNIILIFGIILILNASLQLRAKKYRKQQGVL